MANRRKIGIWVLAYLLLLVGFSFAIGGLVRRTYPVVAMGAFGVYWGLRLKHWRRSKRIGGHW